MFGGLAAPMLSSYLCDPAGDDKGDEEAEYAWLSYYSIKPFAPGDVSGNETGQAPLDPVLAASVVAAEAALTAATAGRQQHSQTEDGSDSDGGWGISREVGAAAGVELLRGAGGLGRMVGCFCLIVAAGLCAWWYPRCGKRYPACCGVNRAWRNRQHMPRSGVMVGMDLYRLADHLAQQHNHHTFLWRAVCCLSCSRHLPHFRPVRFVVGAVAAGRAARAGDAAAGVGVADAAGESPRGCRQHIHLLSMHSALRSWQRVLPFGGRGMLHQGRRLLLSAPADGPPESLVGSRALPASD